MKKLLIAMLTFATLTLPMAACDSKPDPAKTDPSASASASTSSAPNSSASASASSAASASSGAQDGGAASSDAGSLAPANGVTEAEFEEEAEQLITEVNAEDELTKIEKEIGE